MAVFISTETLMPRLGTLDAPIILDVRIPGDVAEDPRAVPGSLSFPFNRMTPLSLPELAGSQDCVVICQKGGKVSQGIASLLRAQGHKASVLQGGQVAWVTAGLPSLAQCSVQPWVVDADMSGSAFAAAYAVLRWINPRAQFLVMTPDQIAAGCAVFDACVLPAVPSQLASHFSIVPSVLNDLDALQVTPDDGIGLEIPEERKALLACFDRLISEDAA